MGERTFHAETKRGSLLELKGERHRASLLFITSMFSPLVTSNQWVTQCPYIFDCYPFPITFEDPISLLLIITYTDILACWSIVSLEFDVKRKLLRVKVDNSIERSRHRREWIRYERFHNVVDRLCKWSKYMTCTESALHLLFPKTVPWFSYLHSSNLEFVPQDKRRIRIMEHDTDSSRLATRQPTDVLTFIEHEEHIS